LAPSVARRLSVHGAGGGRRRWRAAPTAGGASGGAAVANLRHRRAAPGPSGAPPTRIPPQRVEVADLTGKGGGASDTHPSTFYLRNSAETRKK